MLDRSRPRYVLLAPHSGDKKLRRIVADTLDAWDAELIAPEKAESPFGRTIKQAIERADFVIADLTGSNPDVMYEVGYAQALRKPVLPIIQLEDTIPSDLAGQQFFVYQPEKPEELRKHLQIWTNHYLGGAKRAAGL
jgi:nucleoside 2-deoxyribosyltransferase